MIISSLFFFSIFGLFYDWKWTHTHTHTQNKPGKQVLFFQKKDLPEQLVWLRNKHKQIEETTKKNYEN